MAEQEEVLAGGTRSPKLGQPLGRLVRPNATPSFDWDPDKTHNVASTRRTHALKILRWENWQKENNSSDS